MLKVKDFKNFKNIRFVQTTSYPSENSLKEFIDFDMKEDGYCYKENGIDKGIKNCLIIFGYHKKIVGFGIMIKNERFKEKVFGKFSGRYIFDKKTIKVFNISPCFDNFTDYIGFSFQPNEKSVEIPYNEYAKKVVRFLNKASFNNLKNECIDEKLKNNLLQIVSPFINNLNNDLCIYINK